MTVNFDDPLYAAASNGDLTAITMLVDGGMDVNAGNGVTTALHGAAWHGEADAAGLLLAYGATFDVVDERGRTPLFEAVRFYSPNRHAGKLAIIEMLLDQGAVLESQDDNGLTPLALLASDLSNYKYSFKLENRLKNETLQLLVARGAEVNTVAADGSTPILHAVRYGHVFALRDLIRVNADFMQRDSLGISPLRLALQLRQLLIFLYLSAGGVDFATDELLDAEALLADCILKKEAGLPPGKALPDTSLDWFLILAARCGTPAMVSFLVEAGADVNGVANPKRESQDPSDDSYGDEYHRHIDLYDDFTPYAMAENAGNEEMKRCLIDLGARPENEDGADER